MNETVTGPLFQPKLFAEVLVAVITGRVRSTFTGPSVVEAELPAMSMQVPVAVCAAPSPKVTGEEELLTPDNASEQENLTVTGTLFHPAAFGSIDLVLVMTGGVRSTLTPVSVVVAVFPATSVQFPVAD